MPNDGGNSKEAIAIVPTKNDYKPMNENDNQDEKLAKSASADALPPSSSTSATSNPPASTPNLASHGEVSGTTQSLPIALLLGIFVPGLGQIYFGDKKRALLICLSILAASSMGAFLCVLLRNSEYLHIAYLGKSIITMVIYGAQLIDLLRLAPKTTAIPLGQRWQRLRHCFAFVLTTMIFVALPVTLINDLTLRTFAAPTKGMAPSTKDGDTLLVDIYSWMNAEDKPSSILGKAILFVHPKKESEIHFKRVMAGPGDKIRLEDGNLFINDTAVQTIELYYSEEELAEMVEMTPGDKVDFFQAYKEQLHGSEFITLREKDLVNTINNYEEVTVPPNHYFVLGDNRDRSYDSRIWGFVPERNIIGIAKLVIYPGDIFKEKFSTARIGSKIP